MRGFQLPIWFFCSVCVEVAAQQPPGGVFLQRSDAQQYKFQLPGLRGPKTTDQAPQLPEPTGANGNLNVGGSPKIGPLLEAQTEAIKSLSDRIEKLSIRVDKLEAAAKREKP